MTEISRLKGRFLRVAAACVLLLSARSAFAEAPPQFSLHRMQGMGLLTDTLGTCPMIGGMSTFAEEQVAYLKKELAITDAQIPAWNDYASALEAHLRRMLDLETSVLGVLEADSPVGRLRKYNAVMEARLASLKTLEAPMTALYRALSTEQQTKSNRLLSGLGCTM